MYIMWLIIFEEKAEVQGQHPLSLNPIQKADDSIQECNRSIGPLLNIHFKFSKLHISTDLPEICVHA